MNTTGKTGNEPVLFKLLSDINNPEWYFKIISLREEMKQIEDEIALCNDENNIQLLNEKIRKILLKIEIFEEDDEDDEEQPENDI